MLPAGNRLRRAPDFAAAVRGGRRVGRSALVLHLRESAAPAGRALPLPPRVGLVVGKTVGPAVTRNRVKRRLREVVRPRLDALSPGSILVIRALPSAAAASSAELGAELDAGLARLRSRR
ncbi:ribonuclease P protein component [Sporichthya polymorpha]|uniref:ribonuclease P protein component n=1 Tax=Sporichthya polymorpha TaxID=35751 RepID=UPI000364AD40|nr:ribonuclease P protein component [Sporichthya polymorpha]